jgi:hypothetical protein
MQTWKNLALGILAGMFVAATVALEIEQKTRPDNLRPQRNFEPEYIPPAKK